MHSSEFRIAQVSVQINGQCPEDVALVPTLEAFRIAGGAPDISIQIEWEKSFRPAVGTPKVFDSGCVWRLYEHGTDLQFDFCASNLSQQPYKRLRIDSGFQSATLQMNRQFFSGTDYLAAPLDYPLDELLIMHRLTQERAIELHSCGIVGPDGTGNLFVGHSGAGKSTTTRLWNSSEDVEVLSDDRIIVRRDSDAAGMEMPCHASGHDWPTGRFAQDQKSKLRMRMYGTPWHGEAMFASPGSAPLARILILQHGHGNVLTPLSPSEAVAELFARSFVPFHRHEYVDTALDFLQELVEAVPVYRFEFEPDQRAVDAILDLYD
jgi:hypothetical protein